MRVLKLTHLAVQVTLHLQCLLEVHVNDTHVFGCIPIYPLDGFVAAFVDGPPC